LGNFADQKESISSKIMTECFNKMTMDLVENFRE